jgi:hypothetical protein
LPPYQCDAADDQYNAEIAANDAVAPIVLVVAGDRRDRFGLVDRAEQRAADRRIVERRV